MQVDVMQIDIVSQQGVKCLQNPYDFTEVYAYQTGEYTVSFVLFKDSKLVYTITDNVPVVVQYNTKIEDKND